MRRLLYFAAVLASASAFCAAAACYFGTYTRMDYDATYTKVLAAPFSYHFYRLPTLKLSSTNVRQFTLAIPEKPCGMSFGKIFFIASAVPPGSLAARFRDRCHELEAMVQVEILSHGAKLDSDGPAREGDWPQNPSTKAERKRMVCSRQLGLFWLSEGKYDVKILNKRTWTGDPPVEYYVELQHGTGGK